MFGAMPSDFMLLEVGEEPPTEESDEDEEVISPASDHKWDVNKRSALLVWHVRYFGVWQWCTHNGSPTVRYIVDRGRLQVGAKAGKLHGMNYTDPAIGEVLGLQPTIFNTHG